ncbi:MAG: dockerin type I domain-containing protein, partial [Candidatus Zixiibacteriota bacterium]
TIIDELCGCCVVPGDANHNGVVNILDITFTIAYLYKSGPAPACMDEADANSNEVINILDITYNIAYLYKSGPAPICGDLGHK